MPFNPTLPLPNSNVSSAELRAQFNGLKDLHDAQQVFINEILDRLDEIDGSIAALQAQVPTFLTQPAVEAISANNVNGVPELAVAVSDPPTQVEVVAVYDKINEMLNGLYR